MVEESLLLILYVKFQTVLVLKEHSLFTLQKLKKLKLYVKVKLRRAKLYYLRNLRGKAARIKEVR